MIDVIKHGENENNKFRARSNIDFFPGLWFNGDHKPKLVKMMTNKTFFKMQIVLYSRNKSKIHLKIFVNYSNYLYIVNTRLNY